MVLVIMIGLLFGIPVLERLEVFLGQMLLSRHMDPLCTLSGLGLIPSVMTISW